MESNVGIGVVTCGIRKVDPRLIEYFPTIFVDKERRGSSYSKNELIHKFYEDGKEYIFLFDDDCIPVIDGWQEKIIEWSNRYDVHYLAGLDFKGIDIVSGSGDTVVSRNPYIGAYFFMDRKCIETIGYYNEKYDRYGWEDVGYSIRAKKAGLLGHCGTGYPTPVWINMYLHSMDMYAEASIPNMTQEEKNRLIKKNEPLFQEEVNGGNYIGYDRS